MKVAIIGGGASGIACAVSLKRKNAGTEVTVYEKMPRILKKILVTGNGRCNLTNENFPNDSYRGDKALVSAAAKYDNKSTVAFFESMGLVTRCLEEGRVYPVSLQASGVVSVLLEAVTKLGVNVICDTPVKSIEKSGGAYLINGKYAADKVVIASGGSAAKQQGTDGDSFTLLESLGVIINPVHPALTGLVIDGFDKSLKGIRNRCRVSLYKNSDLLYEEVGEIQFNDYGVSGIPVMQLSGLVYGDKKDFSLKVDFIPDFDGEYLEKFIHSQKNECPEKSALTLLTGLVPKMLGSYVLKKAGIKNETPIKDLNAQPIINSLKNTVYSGLTARDFEYAQVTAGGVGADEINPETLELKKHKGIYVTGEALDVDGLCGGYNLQFAWSTGRLAADAVIGEK